MNKSINSVLIEAQKWLIALKSQQAHQTIFIDILTAFFSNMTMIYFGGLKLKKISKYIEQHCTHNAHIHCHEFSLATFMTEDIWHFIESRRRRLQTSRFSCDTRRSSFDIVLKTLGRNETCLGPLTKFLISSKIGQACRRPRGGKLHRETHLETHRESTRWVSRPIVKTHDESQDPS